MSVFSKFRRRPPEERAGTMTLVEHLEELRHRLVVCIAAVGAGAVVGWFLYGPVLDLVLNPYCDYWETIDPKLRINETCSLFFQEPLGAMIVKLKIVVFIGLAVALPVLLYQLWSFIVPGLTRKERRMAVPFVGSSVVLFALGAALRLPDLAEGTELPARVRRLGVRADPHGRPVHHVRDPGGGGLRAGVRVPRPLGVPGAGRGRRRPRSSGNGAATPSWGSRSSRPSSRHPPTPTPCSR